MFIFPLPLLLVIAADADVPTPGNVVAQIKLSATEGGFDGDLDIDDFFGCSVAALGDLDGDGTGDVAVGAFLDDDGVVDAGAVWILFLAPDLSVRAWTKISATAGGFGGALDVRDEFGYALAALGDLDGDGIGDLAVCARDDDDLASGTGAVWILFLDRDGTVKGEQKISALSGGFAAPLAEKDWFGSAVAALGDLDEDGTCDIAVGATGDDAGGSRAGAVYILFLNPDGTVSAHTKITEAQSGFGSTLDSNDFFGGALAGPGDIDGDGVVDLVVGAIGDDDGGTDSGAIYRVCLGRSGLVTSETKVSALQGGFSGSLDDFDAFGASVTDVGDLDGDGLADLAVGANGDDDGGLNAGAVWILMPNASGGIASHVKISASTGGFGGTLNPLDEFGSGVAALGDVNGDFLPDIAVGARRDDDGASNAGAVWLLAVETTNWLDLGFALAGTFDESQLLGVGSLLGGTATSLELTNGLPDGVAHLVIGFSQLAAPFKGGVLVPIPDIIVSFELDRTGEAMLSFPWPFGIPSSTPIWWQAWIPDDGGPLGWAATNALLSTTH